MKSVFFMACRVAIAAVFIAASIPKILSPDQFALSVFRYQLLPGNAVNLVAIMLPWLELVAGVALLFIPRLRDAAALVLLCLLAAFTAAMGINLYRGVDVACGCFSVNPEVSHIGLQNIARNVGFMALTAVAWYESGTAARRR